MYFFEKQALIIKQIQKKKHKKKKNANPYFTENYNNIGDLINSIKDGGKNILNDMGDSLNNWYQGYKNNRK